MSLIVSKHAYRRARQRLGLNRKAFKRAEDNNLLHPDYRLVIDNNVVIIVQSIYSATRNCKTKISKKKIKDYYKEQGNLKSKGTKWKN